MGWTRYGLVRLAALAALALALAACRGDVIVLPQITVAIEPANPSVLVGETVQLTAIVSWTAETAVTWESDATGIATVDASTGLVTGVAPGQAVVTATSTADPDAAAATTVTVEAAPPSVEVTVSPDGQTIIVGATLQLTATVANAASQAVDWVSLTPAIAAADASGLVTGLAAGTATIEATAQADPTAKDQATVVVVPDQGTLLIAGITAVATGQPADPAAISGEIAVTVEFELPPGSDATGLEVLVDDAVQCSYAVGSGGTQSPVDCAIATDALDGAGAPLFPDGAHTITARLLAPGGEIRAETGVTVTFTNAGGSAAGSASSP